MSRLPASVPQVKNQLSSAESARLAELEPVIERGLNNFVEVGNALIEISDQRLYRETHSTFKEYVEDRWRMTARRAYQLCEAAEVVKSLPENVNHGSQINERQARELAAIPAEQQIEVLQEAQSRAEARGAKLTAAEIRNVISDTEIVRTCEVIRGIQSDNDSQIIKQSDSACDDENHNQQP